METKVETFPQLKHVIFVMANSIGCVVGVQGPSPETDITPNIMGTVDTIRSKDLKVNT